MSVENQMKRLNGYLIAYLNKWWHIHKEDVEYKNITSYIEDEFKFETTNNWAASYADFATYMRVDGTRLKLEIPTILHIIQYIIDYYEETFGDSKMFTKNVDLDNILRHYAYVEVSRISTKELKKYLNITEFEELMNNNESEDEASW